MPAPKEVRTIQKSMNWSRRGVLIVGILGAAGAFASPSKTKPPRVLFVCKYGTTKSAIARELFRQRAQSRGVPAIAFSRGLMLEDHISPPLRERLMPLALIRRRTSRAYCCPRIGKKPILLSCSIFFRLM